MPRSTEEILEDLLLAARDSNMREMTISLNRDGPVFSIFGSDLFSHRADPGSFSHQSWGTSSYTADATLSTYVGLVDTSSGPVSLVLPSGLVDTAVQPIVVKHSAGDASVNPVTITDADGKTIDGQPSFILNTAKAAVQLLKSDGFWYVVGLFAG